MHSKSSSDLNDPDADVLRSISVPSTEMYPGCTLQVLARATRDWVKAESQSGAGGGEWGEERIIMGISWRINDPNVTEN